MADDEEQSLFPDYYYITEGKEQEMNFYDLCRLCVWPTLYDTTIHISQIFICCVIFRISAQHLNVPINYKHSISILLGYYILNYYFTKSISHIMYMALASYVILLVPKKRKGPIALFSTIVYLTYNEMSANPEEWTSIRSAEMLIGMKFISVAFDIDNSSRKRMPSLFEYFGYVFCCGSCVFGPWISYSEYIHLYVRTRHSFKWIKKILISLSLTMFFFIMSTCFVEWAIPDTSNRFLLLYRDALIFRCGHYFVCFLSDTTTGLMGMGSSVKPWHRTTHPTYIEVPRSLVQVCVHWNISMHRWFKCYVFRPARPYGAFASILLTYLVSSLLHGLNHRLSAVLLSLGFYTFIEQVLRNKFAEKFDACVGARSCPRPCHMHRNTEAQMTVVIFNLFCGMLAIFHLAYLGALMDTTNTVVGSVQDAFERWKELYFVSHWIVICVYIIYFFV